MNTNFIKRTTIIIILLYNNNFYIYCNSVVKYYKNKNKISTGSKYKVVKESKKKSTNTNTESSNHIDLLSSIKFFMFNPSNTPPEYEDFGISFNDIQFSMFLNITADYAVFYNPTFFVPYGNSYRMNVNHINSHRIILNSISLSATIPIKGFRQTYIFFSSVVQSEIMDIFKSQNSVVFNNKLVLDSLYIQIFLGLGIIRIGYLTPVNFFHEGFKGFSDVNEMLSADMATSALKGLYFYNPTKTVGVLLAGATGIDKRGTFALSIAESFSSSEDFYNKNLKYLTEGFITSFNFTYHFFDISPSSTYAFNVGDILNDKDLTLNINIHTGYSPYNYVAANRNSLAYSQAKEELYKHYADSPIKSCSNIAYKHDLKNGKYNLDSVTLYKCIKPFLLDTLFTKEFFLETKKFSEDFKKAMDDYSVNSTTYSNLNDYKREFKNTFGISTKVDDLHKISDLYDEQKYRVVKYHTSNSKLSVYYANIPSNLNKNNFVYRAAEVSLRNKYLKEEVGYHNSSNIYKSLVSYEYEIDNLMSLLTRSFETFNSKKLSDAMVIENYYTFGLHISSSISKYGFNLYTGFAIGRFRDIIISDNNKLVIKRAAGFINTLDSYALTKYYYTKAIDLYYTPESIKTLDENSLKTQDYLKLDSIQKEPIRSDLMFLGAFVLQHSLLISKNKKCSIILNMVVDYFDKLTPELKFFSRLQQLKLNISFPFIILNNLIKIVPEVSMDLYSVVHKYDDLYYSHSNLFLYQTKPVYKGKDTTPLKDVNEFAKDSARKGGLTTSRGYVGMYRIEPSARYLSNSKLGLSYKYITNKLYLNKELLFRLSIAINLHKLIEI